MLKLESSTVEWILEQMESLTKQIVTHNVWEPQIIAEKIGKFQAFKELLDNAGFESYGLKFKIEMPTQREYANQ